jgi:hypothetical protein
MQVNVTFIEQLKEVLRNNPKAYDQNHYSPNEQARILNPHVCKSAVCIAGHAYMLAKGITDASLLREVDSDLMRRVGSKALGLTVDATDLLFSYAELWPEPFRFTTDTTPQLEQVEKACAYIDFIVAESLKPALGRLD